MLFYTRGFVVLIINTACCDDVLGLEFDDLELGALILFFFYYDHLPFRLVLSDLGGVFDDNGTASSVSARADGLSVPNAPCRGDSCNGAGDRDIAATALFAASDTGCRIPAFGVYGTAVDGDVAAGCFISASDTGRIVFADSCDIAALDDDIACGHAISAADAASVAVVVIVG